jgi:hypothetical protein
MSLHKRSTSKSLSSDFVERSGPAQNQDLPSISQVKPCTDLHKRAPGDEIDLPNPLGPVLETEQNTRNFHTTCRHKSSLPEEEREGEDVKGGSLEKKGRGCKEGNKDILERCVNTTISGDIISSRKPRVQYFKPNNPLKRVRKKQDSRRVDIATEVGPPVSKKISALEERVYVVEAPEVPGTLQDYSAQSVPKRPTTRPSRSASCPSNSKSKPKHESSPIRNRSMEQDKPLKSLSKLDAISGIENDSRETITEAEVYKPDLNILLAAEITETLDSVSAFASKQNKRGTEWISRHNPKTFTSLDDENSFAETACTAKHSIHGIFSHMIHSANSIATRDVLDTLAPFLGRHEYVQKKKCDSMPGSLGALLDANSKLQQSTAPEPSLCPSPNLNRKTLESLLDSPKKFSTLAEPSICFSAGSGNKSLDALLGTNPGKWNARKTAPSNSHGPEPTFSRQLFDESDGSKVPLSLDALLDAQPRNFPSNLPEPSICPPLQSSHVQLDAKVNGRAFLTSAFPNEGAGISRKTNLGPSLDDLFSGGDSFMPSSPFSDNEPHFEAFGDINGSSRSSGCNATPPIDHPDKAGLLQLSKHIKIHRAKGIANSSDSGEDPKYLQLDLSKMGN